MKKNYTLSIVLFVLFALITLTGFYYTSSVQGKVLKAKDLQLSNFKTSYSSTSALQAHLKELEEKVALVDSALFTGKFSIPYNMPQTSFYNFIDEFSNDNSLYTFTNTEYVSQGVENGFNYYTYKVTGNGSYFNVYALIYAIEHGRELMKIPSAEILSNTSVDSKGIPRYLVKFTLNVKAYFSSSDIYASVSKVQNSLNIPGLYNSFYPLVRNEIRPNVNNLPNIQDATLISLVPQGAYITDATGNTYLFRKGDPVYLGYLTDIDYENESVTFVLNKGGIIEFETLKMGQPKKKEGK